MVSNKGSSTALILLLLLAAPVALVSESRRWVQSDRPNETQKREQRIDEIDHAIDRYFRRIEQSTRDPDQAKIERHFGPSASTYRRPGSAEERRIAFANRARDGEGGQRETRAIQSHTVSSGETIWSISQRYGVRPEIILRHNPELENRPLYIGETILIVPLGETPPQPRPNFILHEVQRGETLFALSRRYEISVDELLELNILQKGAVIRVGDRLRVGMGDPLAPEGFDFRSRFIVPVDAPRITSSYGPRRNPFNRAMQQFHRGTDYGAPTGSAIFAAADGIVIYADEMGGYGNVVFVRHVDGYVTVYAHNSKNLVEIGDIVERGQTIAEVGMTGNATGPHLHFEVRQVRTPMDPIAALEMRELVRVDSEPLKAVDRQSGGRQSPSSTGSSEAAQTGGGGVGGQ